MGETCPLSLSLPPSLPSACRKASHLTLFLFLSCDGFSPSVHIIHHQVLTSCSTLHPKTSKKRVTSKLKRGVTEGSLSLSPHYSC